MTVDLLRNRLKTGLEDAPAAADIAISWDSYQIQTLVGELHEDPDLAGIARLVRDFMATFTLPRAPVSPEFGALGGVADISNRGQIHRLLISELANDDDTLALRLAMNEALFLKNAPPIAHPQAELVLLFDLGIRMWGIPRVLATAAALAFLSKTPKKQLSQAWLFRPGNHSQSSGPNTTRVLSQPTPAAPNYLQPVDFTSKDGLLDLLSKLELNQHPGPALDLWDNLASKPESSLPFNGPSITPAEVVLLTHEDTWADTDFREQLHLFLTRQSANGHPVPFYILTFLRDGTTQLRSVSAGGHLLLQSAKINLEPLLPKLSSPLRSKDADIPSFVRLFPPPFLLPTPTNLDSQFVISTPEGYSAGVTDKGSIWHWDSSKHGAVPSLLRPLPGKTVYFSFVETLSSLLIVHLVWDQPHAGQIHMATWTRKRGAKEESYSIFTPIDLPSKPLHFFHRFGILYVLYADMVDVINLRTGKQLVRQSFPHHYHLNKDEFEVDRPRLLSSALVSPGSRSGQIRPRLFTLVDGAGAKV